MASPYSAPLPPAAQLEGSKAFSKEFMRRQGIPTAAFETFDRFEAAEAFLQNPPFGYPLVVKADGLAAGKGVVLADDRDTATAAAREMLVDGRFGDAGGRIVIEEQLVGREVSFFALCDGENFIELATCQDYKRIGDGDEGPNTGGMGTYSPSVFLDDAIRREISDRVVAPTITGMAAEGAPYHGVIYVGLMLTESGPKVLEYNARFGDPETQVLLPRLDGDWGEVLYACATGDLDAIEVTWRPEAAVCIVLASGGYPGSYAKGHPIEGLDAADALEDVIVFHAGTGIDADGRVVTTGGRVLGVTALGSDLATARTRAYEAAWHIRWDGMQRRTDIALDAVTRQQQSGTM